MQTNSLSTAPLHLTKLRTSEDEPRQAVIARLAIADAFARDLVVEGALSVVDDSARLGEGICALSGTKIEDVVGHGDEGDVPARHLLDRQEAAYLIGVAVGLRLARAIA